jgi:hypothetical protein
MVCGGVLGTVMRGRPRGPVGRVGAPESDDDPLHAPSSASPETTTATASGKGLQARSRPVDSMAMEATQLYPDIPADSGRAGLESRVAELERIVATLATLRDERLVEQHLVERGAERRDPQLDPVALTAALHPRGMRSARTRRGSSSDGTLAMRIVLFDKNRH